MVKTSPSRAEGVSSIPGLGSQDPTWLVAKNQNIKQKRCCDKFNKDFKNGPQQQKKKTRKTVPLKQKTSWRWPFSPSLW